jgi:hypothetical protein
MTTTSTHPTATGPKLRLNRQTLRQLTDSDLRKVAGGTTQCGGSGNRVLSTGTTQSR